LPCFAENFLAPYKPLLNSESVLLMPVLGVQDPVANQIFKFCSHVKVRNRGSLWSVAPQTPPKFFVLRECAVKNGLHAIALFMIIGVLV